VAEKVMGLKSFKRHWQRGAHCGYIDAWLDQDGKEIPGQLPEYSSSIVAAWEVFKVAAEKYTAGECRRYGLRRLDGPMTMKWEAYIEREQSTVVATDTDSECLALCLAALKAVGVEV